jgi:hypothetical protein
MGGKGMGTEEEGRVREGMNRKGRGGERKKRGG